MLSYTPPLQAGDRSANTCAKGCTYRKCLSCRKYWLNHVQSLPVLHAFPTVNDMKEGRPVNSLLSVSSGAPDHLSIFNTRILTNAKLDARSGCTAGSHAKTTSSALSENTTAAPVRTVG